MLRPMTGSDNNGRMEHASTDNIANPIVFSTISRAVSFILEFIVD
jgi:hypothetical protein